MKFSILIDMLFDLLSKRKLTAAYLAEKYDISPRTVYRYVELLATKLPLSVKRGRNGGICLSDSYRLPVGFMTDEEYNAAIEALVSAYTADPNTKFLDAKRKLSAQVKRERQNLFILGETDSFYVENTLPWLAEKTRILQKCIQNSVLAEITYLAENGNKVTVNVEPHALLLCKGIWYVYAFCHTERTFRQFSLGQIHTLIQTDVPFRKRPFEWSDVTCVHTQEKQLQIRLAVKESALPALRERLGMEALHKTREGWIAEFPLPDNENTVQYLLSLGNQIEVSSPAILRDKLRKAVQELSKLYP